MIGIINRKELRHGRHTVSLLVTVAFIIVINIWKALSKDYNLVKHLL